MLTTYRHWFNLMLFINRCYMEQQKNKPCPPPKKRAGGGIRFLEPSEENT